MSSLKSKILRRVVPYSLETWSRLKSIDKKPKTSHNLPSCLNLPLTSHPPRFAKLHLTLFSLLNQRMNYDRLLLWIALEDMKSLPKSVLQLQDYGLTIIPTDDMRSYKKIIPTLEQFPNEFIVTADDDSYYHPKWLSELVAQYNVSRSTSICHRARMITLNSKMEMEPYYNWPLIKNSEISDKFNRNFILPTGIGGILYPPGVFSDLVTNRDLFESLCPTADDIWLYWMVRLNEKSAKVVAADSVFYEWVGSKTSALYLGNVFKNKNDEALELMQRRFPLEF
jgi:hypothetical protein